MILKEIQNEFKLLTQSVIKKKQIQNHIWEIEEQLSLPKEMINQLAQTKDQIN
jgi:hypothetical protein